MKVIRVLSALSFAVLVSLIAARPTGHAQPIDELRAAPSKVEGQQAPAAASFDADVKPIVDEICTRCHNEKKANAGLDFGGFLDPKTLASHRDTWEMIADRVKTGDMPPPDEDPLSARERAAMVAYLESAFVRADRELKPDPGRVPAHRLTRVEYANTIRDLLGVDFRASDEFPPDDSGYGFDNIGDVLTVSPALMQRYLAAAEKIAARAVGGGPLPAPGVFSRRNRARRTADGTIELKEILEYDADYAIRVGVQGHRGPDDPPVTMVISVDGTPVKTVTVPVQLSAVNKQGGGTQRALYEVRVFLPGNAHTFRAALVNDETLKSIPQKDRGDVNKNIFPEFLDIAGPFKPQAAQAVPRKALVCNPASGRACVNRIIRTLARRAYRRPVTAADLAPLDRVYARAIAGGYTPAEGVQFTIATMLVSPHFLFRVEKDPRPGTIARVSGVELASRLSYFLWSSTPDEELLRLGETGRLHLPKVLSAQVTRMLADPKAAALAENFAEQWLETRSLDAVTRDQMKFPEWNNELRDAMRSETRLFFDAVLRENRPISDFIDARYTFLNGRLARHYGIAGVEGPDFRRVDLTTDERSGVFTHASVLTVSSYPTRTSVVLRGKYLLENVLNEPPPPPPADVPALDEKDVGAAVTQRVRLEAHRADPLCASCHNKLDPLGFGLENYDAVGRWRSRDGAAPIDATGKFPGGRTFSGPSELKSLLRSRMPQFTKALTERMLIYALGRGVEPSDRLVVRDLVARTAADGYRIQALVQGIVASVPFQQRRGERKAPAQEAKGE
jgi:mono/diheme cytochrome c family protein